jgi:hypothetical protein
MVAHAIQATTIPDEPAIDVIAGELLTQGPQIPQAVVNSRHLASVLGVTDLGQEDGGGHLSQTVTESEDKPACDVHWDN